MCKMEQAEDVIPLQEEKGYQVEPDRRLQAHQIVCDYPILSALQHLDDLHDGIHFLLSVHGAIPARPQL